MSQGQAGIPGSVAPGSARIFDVLRDPRRIELISYGLTVVIGLAMLGGSIYEIWAHRRRGHSSGDQVDPGPADSVPASLVLATGLTPCASAVIILLFALGLGVYLVGVVAPLVMAVGMGVTASIVGIHRCAARDGARARSGGRRRVGQGGPGSGRRRDHDPRDRCCFSDSGPAPSGVERPLRGPGSDGLTSLRRDDAATSRKSR